MNQLYALNKAIDESLEIMAKELKKLNYELSRMKIEFEFVQKLDIVIKEVFQFVSSMEGNIPFIYFSQFF